jgi:hypothetical protein
MRYCRTTTENHPVAKAYPNCVEDINAHMADEGYTAVAPIFTHSETLIDLDNAERTDAILNHRLMNQSMDMTIGIKGHDAAAREMLLVDFKFNVINPNKLKEIDLKGKVDGSTLLLGTSIPVHGYFVFVFQPGIVEQARNRLSRRFCTLPATYIAMSIEDLKNKYFEA